MTNRGTINGLASEQVWQKFTPGSNPILVASDAAGSAVQPNLADSTVLAQYRFDRQLGRVTYQGQIQFSTNATFGSAPFAYNVLLPYPCARDMGGADLLIGSGYLSSGTAVMPLRIVQSDPEVPVGNANDKSYDEDHYMQFFVENNTVTGTSSIASGSTSVTITHGLNTTPVEYDFTITPTNNPTNIPAWWWITNCTSTQFTVNCRQNPTTQGFSFSWKCSSESLLVTDTRPFGTTAAGYVLAWTVEYQARR